MQITKLKVSGFRCLEDQELEFPSQFTLIFGNNGQGKTSLIEAIHLLSHTKSFRTNRLSDISKQDLSGCSELKDLKAFCAQGWIKTLAGVVHIACSYDGCKRSIEINGNKVTSAEGFLGRFTTVAFTSEDMKLAKGAPEARRDFLDRLLVQLEPEYLTALVRYNRAIKQRNQFLGSLTTNYSSTDLHHIEIWDSILAENGLFVAAIRVRYLKLINDIFGRYYSLLIGEGTSDPTRKEFISLINNSGALDEHGEVISGKSWLELMKVNRVNDLRRKRTSFGIHRDNIEVNLHTNYGQGSARNFASQGQARSIAVALVLAAVHLVLEIKGEPPVVLLDDIDSELDADRQRCLYELLTQTPCQVILTSTQNSGICSAIVPNLGYMFVSGGRVEK